MRRPALLALPVLVLAGCGSSARLATAPPPTRTETVARASPCDAPHSGPLDYRWPVRPFDVQHPIRGNFGDPRTVSQQRFGLDDVGDPGAYSFHNGVDISAAPGTPVYPVVSGIARRRHGDEVLVRADGGRRRFQYWHITPAVRDGQRVVAGVTLLGRVQRPARHVHLTEIDNGRVANPAEHLRPYADRTAPVVRDLVFTGTEERLLDPAALSGAAAIVADAYDTPRCASREPGTASRSRPSSYAGRCSARGAGPSCRRGRSPTSAVASRPTRTSGASTRPARTRTSPSSSAATTGGGPGATSSG